MHNLSLKTEVWQKDNYSFCKVVFDTPSEIKRLQSHTINQTLFDINILCYAKCSTSKSLVVCASYIL